MDYKKEFEEALVPHSQEDYHKALEMFLELNRKFQNQSVILAMIANCHFLSDNYEQASIYFKQVLKIKPFSEAASSCLFHSLNETRNADKALAELHRYLSQADSKKGLYVNILEDLLSDIDGPILADYKEFIIKQGTKYGIS